MDGVVDGGLADGGGAPLFEGFLDAKRPPELAQGRRQPAAGGRAGVGRQLPGELLEGRQQAAAQ